MIFLTVTAFCCDCDALNNLTKTTCTNTTKVVSVTRTVTNTGKRGPFFGDMFQKIYFINGMLKMSIN